jgi:hypothetical protein
MAIIRSQNGRVLTKAGKVSCQCCTIDIALTFDFGPQGVCDCTTVECYDAVANPSPATLTVGGVTYTNEQPFTDRVRLPRITIQGPIVGGSGLFLGYNNIVTSPKVMRLFGTVGGDIAITNRRLGTTYPVPDSVSDVSFFIPQEGQFPCGVCPTPRNGPHSVDYMFVLYPTMFLHLNAVSFLNCFPWFRLQLQVVSDAPP